MSNNNPLLYLLTPVEIQPENEGRYVVKTDDGFFEVNYNERYGFHEEFTDCSGVTHWLRLVSEEMLWEVMEKVWEASADHNIDHERTQGVFHKSKYPDRETSITNAIKALKP